jgi:ankyrin repeat protein
MMAINSVFSTIQLLDRLLRYGAGGFRVLVTIVSLAGLSTCPLNANEVSESHLAASSGDLDRVERLIRSGQDVNVRDSLDRSLLWLASSNGHAQVVSRLIAGGAEVDAEDRFGVSPLVVAVKRGYRDVVRELLKGGVQVNSRLRSKFIPLHVAVEQADVGLVFLLLAAGADPLRQQVTGDPGTDFVRNAMIRTRLRGLTQNAFLFLDAGPAEVAFPIDQPYPSARFTVSNDDGVTVFETQISKGLHPPSAQIVWDGRGQTGDLLGTGDYVFLLRFPSGQTQSTARRVVSYRQLSLHDASAYCRPEIVTALVSDGVDVDASDSHGRTALMYAAAFGNVGTADALLASGADLDLRDGDQRNAVAFAANYAPGQPINAILEKAATADKFSR